MKHLLKLLISLLIIPLNLEAGAFNFIAGGGQANEKFDLHHGFAFHRDGHSFYWTNHINMDEYGYMSIDYGYISFSDYEYGFDENTLEYKEPSIIATPTIGFSINQMNRLKYGSADIGIYIHFNRKDFIGSYMSLKHKIGIANDYPDNTAVNIGISIGLLR